MTEHSHSAPKTGFNFRRNRLALAAAGLLAVGGAAGAVTVAATRPSVTMAPATPVAIRSLQSSGQSDGIVTIRGTVAEIYGNKFVMADPTGRALVDLGREGEDGTLVTAGQPVTVQGRFEDGFVHAAFLIGAGGKVTALGPIGGPPHGPGGPGRDGPGGPGGPGSPGGPPPPAGMAPPPPPMTAGAAPAPVGAPAGVPAPTAAPAPQATPAT
jgi:uncharacterized protein YdeI (BOF family)